MTRDVEDKSTPAIAISKFGIACDGRKKDEVSFFDCTAFGKTAELIAQYFGKGRPIFVHGRLQQDRWETKDGDKRSKVVLIVEGFQFVPRDKQDDSGGEGEYATDTQNDIPF